MIISITTKTIKLYITIFSLILAIGVLLFLVLENNNKEYTEKSKLGQIIENIGGGTIWLAQYTGLVPKPAPEEPLTKEELKELKSFIDVYLIDDCCKDARYKEKLIKKDNCYKNFQFSERLKGSFAWDKYKTNTSHGIHIFVPNHGLLYFVLNSSAEVPSYFETTKFLILNEDLEVYKSLMSSRSEFDK